MTNVGLFIGRVQPLHFGHCQLINYLIENCEVAIVGLGSVQKKREKHNPFTQEERQQMIRNVYGDRVKIVPLVDLNATTPDQWCEYVIEKIKKVGLPEPNLYVSGSEADSYWYKDWFQAHGKTLVIHNRSQNVWPAATEVRMFLELRTDGWKKWTPRVNHKLIQDKYPEEYKIPESEEIPF